MRICSELENLSVLLEDMPRHSTCKGGKKKKKRKCAFVYYLVGLPDMS